MLLPRSEANRYPMGLSVGMLFAMESGS